ncbi:a2945344-39b6-4c1d-b8d5-8e8a106dee72 [Thermothielavioides terrestris]|uniref:A2945344-39b6-4c1d-b8d5-8e8a106dee72 n=1 Tax=Thermothielavioides terrestris TaxID=2587410 RepID=A0A446BNH2_9PEZI|nr:a2945344-39b6-4c1d-b8d5-8e8a106dee72 [Thermothielavioides terrestris]
MPVGREDRSRRTVRVTGLYNVGLAYDPNTAGDDSGTSSIFQCFSSSVAYSGRRKWEKAALQWLLPYISAPQGARYEEVCESWRPD